MGYPEGVKGYRVRDVATGTFFNSRDVIFDESHFLLRSSVPGSSISLAPTSSLVPVPVPDPFVPMSDPVPSLVPSDPVPLPTAPIVDQIPVTPVPVVPVPVPRLALRAPSSRTKTALGELHASEVASAKARRERLAIAHTERLAASTHVFNDDHANLVCSESAFLSIRSDRPRNPSVASYDLKVPPATYSEARRRPDFHVWEATVIKELDTLRSMGVYSLSSATRSQGNRQPLGLRKQDRRRHSHRQRSSSSQGVSSDPRHRFRSYLRPGRKVCLYPSGRSDGMSTWLAPSMLRRHSRVPLGGVGGRTLHGSP